MPHRDVRCSSRTCRSTSRATNSTGAILTSSKSDADDTYLQAPGDIGAPLDAAANTEGYVYTAFAAGQALLLETCGVTSNAKKVKVLLHPSEPS